MLSFFDFWIIFDVMKSLSRKQREIQHRHTMMLELAETILHTEGFAALSMDRIAELSEYSKGTVYQHFACKEEILIQCCISHTQRLTSFFERASRFEGRHRERLLAIFFAHDLWATLEPKCQELLQTVGADGIRDKVRPESLQEHSRQETELIKIVATIVGDAIEAGELKLDESLNPVELVFGLWSLSYGSQLIRSYDIPLKDYGVRDAVKVITRLSGAMLDGLGWKPLGHEFNYDQSLERIGQEIFPEELASLKIKCRGDEATVAAEPRLISK